MSDCASEPCRSDAEEDVGPEGAPPVASKKEKSKKRTWNRGAHITPQQRAAQFPGNMEVRGEAMWCRICDALVDHKEKSTATVHCRTKKHQAMLKKRPLAVFTPGPAVQPKKELEVLLESGC